VALAMEYTILVALGLKRLDNPVLVHLFNQTIFCNLSLLLHECVY